MRLAERLSSIFLGMSARLTYVITFAVFMMCAYWTNRASRLAPVWFVEASRSITGIGVDTLHRQLYSHTVAVVFLLLIPAAFAVFVERLSLKELGLGVEKASRELGTITVLFVLSVPLLYWASQQPAFQAKYPRIDEASADAWIFTLFHAMYFIKWVAWEFFFRGFMLFVLARDLGGNAVLLSTVPFTLMHYGKPTLEMFGAWPAGFVLCWLALRSQSIWPGVLLHWAASITLELFATRWFWDMFS